MVAEMGEATAEKKSSVSMVDQLQQRLADE
jgi:hypothetical protein